jgi:hypothetical protein
MAGGGGGGGGGGAAKAKAVPMHRLFAFADRRDAAMMAVGAAAAVANGLAMPFLTFIMGDLVDAFGAVDRAGIVHVVSKVWSLATFPFGWFNLRSFLDRWLGSFLAPLCCLISCLCSCLCLCLCL